VSEQSWIVVGVSLTAVALKASGPLILGGRRLPPRFGRAIGLLPIAILSSLVVSQTLVTDRSVGLDARVIGIVAALALVGFRAPVALIVLASAGATAAARALGWN
jgi:branched-subunit amino acid transport protein